MKYDYDYEDYEGIDFFKSGSYDFVNIQKFSDVSFLFKKAELPPFHDKT